MPPPSGGAREFAVPRASNLVTLPERVSGDREEPQTVTDPPQTALVRAGDPCEGFLYLIRGRIRVALPGGREIVCASRDEAFVAQRQAVFENQWIGDITTLSSCTYSVLNMGTLYDLFRVTLRQRDDAIAQLDAERRRFAQELSQSRARLETERASWGEERKALELEIDLRDAALEARNTPTVVVHDAPSIFTKPPGSVRAETATPSRGPVRKPEAEDDDLDDPGTLKGLLVPPSLQARLMGTGREDEAWNGHDDGADLDEEGIPQRRTFAGPPPVRPPRR
jgi:hypothetical protein